MDKKVPLNQAKHGVSNSPQELFLNSEKNQIFHFGLFIFYQKMCQFIIRVFSGAFSVIIT
jgi:hypothetical protein